MRKIASLLAILVSVILVAPCFAPSQAYPTNGLVGCWRFEEGSGTTALDSSGSGNNGVMTNATYTDDTPGQIVSMFSLRFNNTAGNANSYVRIPDNSSLRPSSGLTLAAWIKADTVETRSCVIVSKQYGSSYHDSFALWYQYGNVNFVLDSGTNYRGISAAKPSANEWHYIVGTYNGSSMLLYVDGVERAHDAFTGAIVYDNNPVLIGADSDQASHTPDAGWNGFIDEVLIYNRALSHAEIAQIVPEFPSVLALSLVMLATMAAAVVFTRRLRKQATPAFS